MDCREELAYYKFPFEGQVFFFLPHKDVDTGGEGEGIIFFIGSGQEDPEETSICCG
jgi:hypothetical protein